MRKHQNLPTRWAEREALREKGQFWTPAWVAEAMAAYVLSGGSDHVFDPAVGEGAFFRAAQAVAAQQNRGVTLLGTELDADLLRIAQTTEPERSDFAQVQCRDFALNPPTETYAAILGNPPYVRHHRLTRETKATLQTFVRQWTGLTIDGRAGLHVYFLLRALERLQPAGRLAFLLPADVCEGKFAAPLWDWITQRFRLEAVVTFAPAATPFPGVDTNALVFLLQNAPPRPTFVWAHTEEAWTERLTEWVRAGLPGTQTAAVTAVTRTVEEGTRTGFSRPPRTSEDGVISLGDFARVMRGVATGANDFFLLTETQVSALDIPHEWLVRAVGRTRDVTAATLTGAHLQTLERSGRPTWLLSLDGRPMETLPVALQRYLQQGEALGLPHKALIGQRRPWYKMEVRPPPPFLFAYLGRRNIRFVRNEARAIPLTGFLCVYPHQRDSASLDKLWMVLQHKDTIANLAQVGKSYGSGAIKVEPRALERLPLPPHVVVEAGLTPFCLAL